MADEKDVKTSQEASPDPAKAVADTDGKPAEKSVIEPGDDGKIPYGRFKEKVDETRELKRQIKALESAKEAEIKQTAAQYQQYYETEIAKIQRQASREEDTSLYDYDDPSTKLAQEYEKRINTLNDQIEKMGKRLNSLQETHETERLQTKISSLKDTYPFLDEEHVYAVKKMKPDWDLDECAEYSHEKFKNMVKSRYDKMMEEKKKIAEKQKVMVESGRINLKPEERPKNKKEAAKKFREYIEKLE